MGKDEKKDHEGGYDGFDLKRRFNKFEDRLERKLQNKYI